MYIYIHKYPLKTNTHIQKTSIILHHLTSMLSLENTSYAGRVPLLIIFLIIVIPVLCMTYCRDSDMKCTSQLARQILEMSIVLRSWKPLDQLIVYGVPHTMNYSKGSWICRTKEFSLEFYHLYTTAINIYLYM